MRLELRIEHAHAPERVERKLHEIARARGVSVSSGGDGSGELEKKVGFLGRVRARYVIAATHVEFVVIEAPALLGERALRSMLEDEIARELAALGDDPTR
jgi:hypothetical protein